MFYQVDKPYPVPRVEGKNPYYAALLLQDYAGKTSEDTAIHLYIYQFITKIKEEKKFAEILNKIAEVEMHHLSLLGQTIELLGVDPKYLSIGCSGEEIFWDAKNISYQNTISEMLKVDIESESHAIATYEEHLKIIQDPYIQELLARIIEDEKTHLSIFHKLQEEFGK